jgi:hypothetical protein
VAGAPHAARPDVAEARVVLACALRAGPVEIRARGVSMRPLLRSGDRVRLEARAPRRGDVALVALDERLVLHRLVRRRGARWLVRGDARPRADGWVASDRILAVATARGRECRGGPHWQRLDGGAQRFAGLARAVLRRLASRVRPAGWRARTPRAPARDAAPPSLAVPARIRGLPRAEALTLERSGLQGGIGTRPTSEGA